MWVGEEAPMHVRGVLANQRLLLTLTPLRVPLGAWADMSVVHILLTQIEQDSSAPPVVATPMTTIDSGKVVYRTNALFLLDCEELALEANYLYSRYCLEDVCSETR